MWKNWCFFNCDVGEDSWESLGLQGDQSSQSWRNQSRVFIGRTDAEAEVPVLWPPNGKHWLIRKDPYAEKLNAGGEGDDWGWDYWMAVWTQWTWVLASSRRWWRTEKPGLLLSRWCQRVDMAEQLNNKRLYIKISTIDECTFLFFFLFFYFIFLWIHISFFSFIFISWRLITLQYCSGFCHTFLSVMSPR